MALMNHKRRGVAIIGTGVRQSERDNHHTLKLQHSW